MCMIIILKTAKYIKENRDEEIEEEIRNYFGLEDLVFLRLQYRTELRIWIRKSRNRFSHTSSIDFLIKMQRKFIQKSLEKISSIKLVAWVN